MLPRSEDEKRISVYGKIGIGLSIAIVVLCAIYFALVWPHIMAMKPNEFGDLLAGILGPLALLWLVLGFFQQGEELRQSVKALELQSEELRNSVEQQASLVEVTREQAQAELAALNEEREARRLASAPRFIVHAGGGSRSGNQISQNITFHNVGAIASDVKIVVESDTGILLDQFWSMWGAGQRETLKIQHLIDERPQSLNSNIICRDRFGGDIVQELKLVADPENLHRYIAAVNSCMS